MLLVTGGVMAYFARREPFDSMHQKRLFVLHHENVSACLVLSKTESLYFLFLVSCKHTKRSCIWLLQMEHLAWRALLWISQASLEWRGSMLLLL